MPSSFILKWGEKKKKLKRRHEEIMSISAVRMLFALKNTCFVCLKNSESSLLKINKRIVIAVSATYDAVINTEGIRGLKRIERKNVAKLKMYMPVNQAKLAFR